MVANLFKKAFDTRGAARKDVILGMRWLSNGLLSYLEHLPGEKMDPAQKLALYDAIGKLRNDCSATLSVMDARSKDEDRKDSGDNGDSDAGSRSQMQPLLQ